MAFNRDSNSKVLGCILEKRLGSGIVLLLTRRQESASKDAQCTNSSCRERRPSLRGRGLGIFCFFDIIFGLFLALFL
jgi:hypothetical protein